MHGLRMTQAHSTSTIYNAILPEKTDNTSIVLVNRYRIIRSIPRCSCRWSFSSNFHWIDCRRGPASDLLAIHFGEDDFRSDVSPHERACVQLLTRLSVIILGFGSPRCHCCMLRVAPCLLDQILFRPSGHPPICYVDQALPDSLELRVAPFLLIGLVGLVGSCCCSLLHQNSNLFAN